MLSASDFARISIRLNAGSRADVDLIAELADAGRAPVEVRVPNLQSPQDLAAAATLGLPLHALIESARGVQALRELAARPAVVAVGLGEADLRGELGLGAESALAYCRSALVVAAAAAGLRPPAMSVFPDLTDLAGLVQSCRRGRSLGMVGRSAVHPSQIPVIRAAFIPSADEIANARATLAALEAAAHGWAGVARTESGSMVDAAMRRHAERVIAFDRS